MRHPVTAETTGLLEALGHIRQRVQPRLDGVSLEAREEWVSLLVSLPTEEEVGLGFIDMSSETLAWMIAKAMRFEQIVKGARCPTNETLSSLRRPHPWDKPRTEAGGVEERS